MPSDWAAPNASAPITVSYDDFTAIPFPAGKIPGGSSVLTVLMGVGLLMNVSMRRFYVTPGRSGILASV